MSSKMMTIPVKCPFCHKEYTVEVPTDGYNRWIGGELIQRAMPEVSADDREALVSGICSDCWNIFGGDC